MRELSGAIFVSVLGLSLGVVGCAGGVANAPAGEGGSTTATTTATTTGAGGEGGGVTCTDEVCDGADNNCDGVVDEGCECLAGDTRPCYSGPAGTENVGACVPGGQACNPATNTFGPCVGEALPAATETCNSIDDDCNGMVDDAIPDVTCGIGACASTAPGCVAGAVGVCQQGSPSAEACDAIDNDCDQLVDEDFAEENDVCDSGVPGICSAGTMQCVSGAPTCVSDLLAGGEICDSLDNDCDGVVDDNVPGTGGGCSTGYPGVCSAGAIDCQGGVIDCFSIVPASPEICDGLDNDCDGVADFLAPGGTCDTGQLGACGVGTPSCSGQTLICTPNASVSAEVCNGVDDNCEGSIDEGNPGAGTGCSCGGTTVCQVGQLFCQGCTKEVDCNDGLDDEGDGSIDCADSQCALGCNANVAPCAAGETLLVVSSTDVPKTIADNATATSTLTVTEAVTVKRVVMQLNITHSWDSDMAIKLVSPAGTSIDTSSGNGGSSDNYTSTIFNDGCATLISAGTAPFNGCFKPEQAFSAINGQSATGVWKLTVQDTASGDTGSLTSWTLALCVQ